MPHRPCGPCACPGRPGQAATDLVNLGSNAIKFTHRGEVVIRVSVDGGQDDKLKLLFEVRDTGIGIPREKLSALFSPFTQVDGSTTRKYAGTGLGLSISKQLVELMGGAVGVESEEGKGSTFWFTVVFERQPGSQAFPGLRGLSGTRVLVVDDHATNRTFLSTLLRSWGCETAQAEDGETALYELREAARGGKPYAIALLDMHMPGMDGETLGSRIKSDRRACVDASDHDHVPGRAG